MVAYLIWGIILFLGMFNRKSKLVSIILTVYAILAIGLNTFSADFGQYLFMYKNINSGLFLGYEPMYVFLNSLCLNMGISFTAFRCVVSVIGLFLVLIAARRLSNNHAFFLSILIVYPVLGYMSGIRSLIPFAVSLMGVSFLIREEKKSLLKFYVCILIAIMFHYSFIIYLAVPMWKKISKFDKKVTVFALEIIAILLWNRGIFLNIASKIISHEKVLFWLNPFYYQRPSLIAGISICGIMFAIWYWMKSRLIANTSSIEIKSKREEGLIHVETVIGILDLNMYFIPVLLINMNYERILILPFVVGLACLSNIEHFSSKKIQFEVKLLSIAFFLCITINNIIHHNIYFTALENNVIIQFLGG